MDTTSNQSTKKSEDDYIDLQEFGRQFDFDSREAADYLLGLGGHQSFADQVRYIDNDDYRLIKIYRLDMGKFVWLLQQQQEKEQKK